MKTRFGGVNLFGALAVLCSSFSLASAVNCVLNPYYNPICGSDNRTYGNRHLFNCYNRYRPRQRRISIVSYSECEPLLCPSYEALQGFWVSSAPVCASNGFTYGDLHQVRCLKDFIPSLEVLHEGGCTLFEVRKALGSNARKQACGETRRIFEKNPMCTKLNETFSNPFQALCAKSTGLHEKVGGACGSSFQHHCERAHAIQLSLRRAPINERTRNVVCGSDMRTYRSLHHLECTRRFNFNLHALYHGRCKKIDEPCPESLKYIKVPKPVCASNNRSYTSYEALLCAKKRMLKDIKYVHTGACVQIQNIDAV